MAVVGTGFSFHNGAWHGIGNGHLFVYYLGAWHPAKEGWAFDVNTHTWKKWYPHAVATHPTHTATAAAHIYGGAAHWSISSSRHVVSQHITIVAGPGVHVSGRLNGHTFSLNPGESFSLSVSTSARRATLTWQGGHISRAIVRYAYT